MMNALDNRMQNLTDIEKELAKSLKNVFDDFEFIACNIIRLRRNEDDIRRVLDFIRNEESVSSSAVNLFILNLKLARESNNN